MTPEDVLDPSGTDTKAAKEIQWLRERIASRMGELEHEVALWRAGTPPLPWRGIYANQQQTEHLVKSKHAEWERAEKACADRDVLKEELDLACAERDFLKEELDLMHHVRDSMMAEVADYKAFVKHVEGERETWKASYLSAKTQLDAVQETLDTPSREEKEYVRAMAILGRDQSDPLDDDLSDHVYHMQKNFETRLEELEELDTAVTHWQGKAADLLEELDIAVTHWQGEAADLRRQLDAAQEEIGKTILTLPPGPYRSFSIHQGVRLLRNEHDILHAKCSSLEKALLEKNQPAAGEREQALWLGEK